MGLHFGALRAFARRARNLPNFGSFKALMRGWSNMAFGYYYSLLVVQWWSSCLDSSGILSASLSEGYPYAM